MLELHFPLHLVTAWEKASVFLWLHLPTKSSPHLGCVHSHEPKPSYAQPPCCSSCFFCSICSCCHLLLWDTATSKSCLRPFIPCTCISWSSSMGITWIWQSSGGRLEHPTQSGTTKMHFSFPPRLSLGESVCEPCQMWGHLPDSKIFY